MGTFDLSATLQHLYCLPCPFITGHYNTRHCLQLLTDYLRRHEAQLTALSCCIFTVRHAFIQILRRMPLRLKKSIVQRRLSKTHCQAHVQWTVKADSHITCRAAKGLVCVFSHLIYIVRLCLIHTCHAAPMPSCAVALRRTAWSEHGMGAAWQVWIRHGRTV
jgi:hypothetical protein